MQHPQWFSGSNRIAAREKVFRIDPQCFLQGRWLAHHEGRNAVSRSLSAWLLRRRPFSGTPGGPTLAAYPCRNLQGSSREFCTGTDLHR